MNEIIFIKILIIGLVGAYSIDVWSYFLSKAFAIKSLDYRLLGRWVGHMPNGQFFHNTITDTKPVQYELILGWITHSLIGITFAFLLVGLYGLDWVTNPTFVPAIIVGLLTLAGPFLLMQPALGYGIAASKTPRPLFNRIKSIFTHLVFGIGLFLGAIMSNIIFL